MDRSHVTNEGFEYRWSSCGAKQLKTGVVLLYVYVYVCTVCVCLGGLVVSSCCWLVINTTIADNFSKFSTTHTGNSLQNMQIHIQ